MSGSGSRPRPFRWDHSNALDNQASLGRGAALHPFQHPIRRRPTRALAHSSTQHAGPACSRIRNKDDQSRATLRMHLARLHRPLHKHLLAAAVARLHLVAACIPARCSQPARLSVALPCIAPASYARTLLCIRWAAQSAEICGPAALTPSEAFALTLHSMKSTALASAGQLDLRRDERLAQGHHRDSARLYSRNDTFASSAQFLHPLLPAGGPRGPCAEEVPLCRQSTFQQATLSQAPGQSSRLGTSACKHQTQPSPQQTRRFGSPPLPHRQTPHRARSRQTSQKTKRPGRRGMGPAACIL